MQLRETPEIADEGEAAVVGRALAIAPTTYGHDHPDSAGSDSSRDHSCQEPR